MTSAGVNVPVALLSFLSHSLQNSFWPLGVIVPGSGGGCRGEEAAKNVVCAQPNFGPCPVPLLKCKKGTSTEQTEYLLQLRKAPASVSR